MQPDILGYTTVIGIKVTVAPLVLGVSSPFFVKPVIIYPNGHHIFPTVLDVGSQVKTYGHGTVFMQTQVLAVDVEIGPLAYTFEFHKHLLAFGRCRQAEVLAIPHDGIRQIVDIQFEGFVFIKRTGKGHFFPIGIGIFRFFSLGHIAYIKQPVRIEIILVADIRFHTLAYSNKGQQ